MAPPPFGANSGRGAPTPLVGGCRAHDREENPSVPLPAHLAGEAGEAGPRCHFGGLHRPCTSLLSARAHSFSCGHDSRSGPVVVEIVAQSWLTGLPSDMYRLTRSLASEYSE